MGCRGNSMQELPGFTVRVANWWKSTLRWGSHLFPHVTEEVFQKRLSICAENKCGMLVADSHCKHPECGCPLAKKAARATEFCPLGFWAAEVGDNVLPAQQIQKSPPPKRLTVDVEKVVVGKFCSGQHIPIIASFRALNGIARVKVICKNCGQPFLFNGEPILTSPISPPVQSSSASSE